MAINRIQHKPSQSAAPSQTQEKGAPTPLSRSSSRADPETQSALAGTPKHLSTRSSNGLAPRSADLSKLQEWKGTFTKGLKTVSKNAESLGKQMGKQMGNAALQTGRALYGSDLVAHVLQSNAPLQAGRALYRAADRLFRSDDVRHDPYAGYSEAEMDEARYYNQEPRSRESDSTAAPGRSMLNDILDMHHASAARAERGPVMKWEPVDRQSEKAAAEYDGVEPDYNKMVEVVDVQATRARDRKLQAEAQARKAAPPAADMPKPPKMTYRPTTNDDRNAALREQEYYGDYGGKVDLPDKMPDDLKYQEDMETYRQQMADYRSKPKPQPSRRQALDQVAERLEARASQRRETAARMPAPSMDQLKERMAALQTSSRQADRTTPRDGQRSASAPPTRTAPQSVRTQRQASVSPSRSQTAETRGSDRTTEQRSDVRVESTRAAGPEVVGQRMTALLERISPKDISANKDPAHLAALVTHLAHGTSHQTRVDRLDRLDLLGKRVMVQWKKFTDLCEKSGADPAQLMRNHANDVVSYLIGSDVDERVQAAVSRMNPRAGG